ncbi:hypothetical protein [Candidatus Thiosymbion oneisti]|uniref:hypothetical protein n=1 Tax=Candidatus Thiosymbion oneisti TaxID=589554 RepID=UPI000B7DE103|nr:hypothetical protein [Candidatus Thiosymbion oneisti]
MNRFRSTKLCRKCSSPALPFFVVFFVAGVSAYLTWLTLTYSGVGKIELIAGSVGVFLAVGATLLHYVVSCMKRHCRHDQAPEHR